jgi:hypothetical protein
MPPSISAQLLGSGTAAMFTPVTATAAAPRLSGMSMTPKTSLWLPAASGPVLKLA